MPKTIKKKKLTARKGDFQAVIASMGVEDAIDDEWLSNYIFEATSSFLREWSESVVDDYEVSGPEQLAEEAEPDVNTAIADNVNANVWDRQKHALADTIERAAERAKVDMSVSVSDKGEVIVTFDPKDMMRAWAEETEGIGLAAWDPSLKHGDIENVSMIVSILRHRDEVYGHGNMERDYRGHFEGFEPETGRYHELAKIAAKAVEAQG